MNENAKLWVAALRSGGFQQAREALRKQDAYCCLGVGCELYRRATGDGKWEFREGKHYWVGADGYAASGGMPQEVRHWLGLRSMYGELADAAGKGSLATMNDSGANFGRIAEVIESEPEGLFNGLV